jgi:hypothetical protein
VRAAQQRRPGGNHWWESVNLKHLFPVGEVNGSHGVYRPGGSALNSGQVGGLPRRRSTSPAVESGVGSRGSSMVLDATGTRAHERLGPEWIFAPPNPDFQARVLETAAQPDGTVATAWVPRRPLPTTDAWFETAWSAYRKGEIYR